MDTAKLLEARQYEKSDLGKTVAEFAAEMDIRLCQKVDEGYGGWAETDWNIIDRIEAEVAKLKAATTMAERRRRAVDLANFACFEWFRCGGVDGDGTL